ncbi:uncharacterized protein C8A04DRAFT_24481 [Dichotomopilus funicola]|uniref:Uncharacterized protein n=1 Tax=Dichotomopilus funicola TaxID=1934379 RepID=A0AAN6VBA0_9PEZI|nr:hypothetical protein C8A04DRAFT_24481 [Dichotomopilus funicola]
MTRPRGLETSNPVTPRPRTNNTIHLEQLPPPSLAEVEMYRKKPLPPLPLPLPPRPPPPPLPRELPLRRYSALSTVSFSASLSAFKKDIDAAFATPVPLIGPEEYITCIFLAEDILSDRSPGAANIAGSKTDQQRETPNVNTADVLGTVPTILDSPRPQLKSSISKIRRMVGITPPVITEKTLSANAGCEGEDQGSTGFSPLEADQRENRAWGECGKQRLTGDVSPLSSCGNDGISPSGIQSPVSETDGGPEQGQQLDSHGVDDSLDMGTVSAPDPLRIVKRPLRPRHIAECTPKTNPLGLSSYGVRRTQPSRSQVQSAELNLGAHTTKKECASGLYHETTQQIARGLSPRATPTQGIDGMGPVAAPQQPLDGRDNMKDGQICQSSLQHFPGWHLGHSQPTPPSNGSEGVTQTWRPSQATNSATERSVHNKHWATIFPSPDEPLKSYFSDSDSDDGETPMVAKSTHVSHTSHTPHIPLNLRHKRHRKSIKPRRSPRRFHYHHDTWMPKFCRSPAAVPTPPPTPPLPPPLDLTDLFTQTSIPHQALSHDPGPNDNHDPALTPSFLSPRPTPQPTPAATPNHSLSRTPPSPPTPPQSLLSPPAPSTAETPPQPSSFSPSPPPPPTKRLLKSKSSLSSLASSFLHQRTHTPEHAHHTADNHARPRTPMAHLKQQIGQLAPRFVPAPIRHLGCIGLGRLGLESGGEGYESRGRGDGEGMGEGGREGRGRLEGKEEEDRRAKLKGRIRVLKEGSEDNKRVDRVGDEKKKSGGRATKVVGFGECEVVAEDDIGGGDSNDDDVGGRSRRRVRVVSPPAAWSAVVQSSPFSAAEETPKPRAGRESPRNTNKYTPPSSGNGSPEPTHGVTPSAVGKRSPGRGVRSGSQSRARAPSSSPLRRGVSPLASPALQQARCTHQSPLGSV